MLRAEMHMTKSNIVLVNSPGTPIDMANYRSWLSVLRTAARPLEPYVRIVNEELLDYGRTVRVEFQRTGQRPVEVFFGNYEMAMFPLTGKGAAHAVWAIADMYDIEQLLEDEDVG